MRKTKLLAFLMIVLSVLLAACNGSTNSADGQAEEVKTESGYPKKPVTIYNPFSAGGPADLLLREFASKAEKKIGQKVIIINETGGAGLTMYSKLAKEKPDGYTLGLMGTTLFAVNPLVQDLDHSPDDFNLVSSLMGFPYVVAIREDAPYKDFNELIEYSKKHELTFASPALVLSGFGEIINKEEDYKLKWKTVNYKGGAEASAAVLGKHADLFIGAPGNVLGAVESGDIKVVAALNEKGISSMKDVPTLKELGYDLVLDAQMGLGGPKGLPDDVKQVWSEVVSKTLKDKELQAFANKIQMDLVDVNPDELDGYFKHQKTQFSEVIPRITE